MKKLTKSSNKKIAGVCGGLAEYMNCDPLVIRLLTVVAAFITVGVVVLAYIVGAIVIPEK